MHNNDGKTVGEILKGKQANIKNVALAPGSPSWEDIAETIWEDIVKRAKRRLPGYRTIKKLLEKEEYNK